MNDVYVYDNFLTHNEYDSLYIVFGSSMLDWYYNDTINFSIDGDDSDYNFQFTHDIYQFEKSGVLSLQNSEFKLSYKELIYPILTKLNAKFLLRMKFNMNMRTNEIIESNFHVDIGTSLPYLDLNPNTYKLAANGFGCSLRPTLAFRFSSLVI